VGRGVLCQVVARQFLQLWNEQKDQRKLAWDQASFFFSPPSLHPKLVSLGLFFTGQRIELLKLQGINMPFIASATQLSGTITKPRDH